jgi:hypothetical protein
LRKISKFSIGNIPRNKNLNKIKEVMRISQNNSLLARAICYENSSFPSDNGKSQFLFKYLSQGAEINKMEVPIKMTETIVSIIAKSPPAIAIALGGVGLLAGISGSGWLLAIGVFLQVLWLIK